MAIYYLCPESNHPTGGIKVIYRHVDILNAHGIPAFVLHQKKGFRCTWFSNKTKIAHTRYPIKSFFSRARNKIRQKMKGGDVNTIPVVNGASSKVGPNDILVITEMQGPDLATIGKGIPKVILNQNGFLTFKGYSFARENLKTPYLDDTVRAVLVNSEHCEEYVKYAFPDVVTHRFFLSIDPDLFHFQPRKKKQICLSRIKNQADAMQVINILKFHGMLSEFEVVPFINIPQEQVAALMRESLIFLSFGYHEGFGLPAAEAMACGCIVVGYDGWGGKEFFKSEHSYPIDDGDIIGYAKQVEQVIKAYNSDENYFYEQRRQAAEFIAMQYSIEREERELIGAWRQILASNH